MFRRDALAGDPRVGLLLRLVRLAVPHLLRAPGRDRLPRRRHGRLPRPRRGNWSSRDRSGPAGGGPEASTSGWRASCPSARAADRALHREPPLPARGRGQPACRRASRSSSSIRSGDMPAYFNGRHAASLGARSRGTRAADRRRRRFCAALAERRRRKPWRQAPLPAAAPPRAGAAGPKTCTCVVPALRRPRRSRRDPGLAALLRRRTGSPIWSDEWCRIWEVDVDSAGTSPRSRRRSGGTMGALVEIVDVSLVEPLPAELRGGFVDEPRPGRCSTPTASTCSAGRWAPSTRRRRGRVLDRRQGLLAGRRAGRTTGPGGGVPGAIPRRRGPASARRST